MTLTPPMTVALMRLLSHLRPDWHDAGVHSAVVKLATDPRDPFTLVDQAIRQASIAAHRTPECITWTTTGAAPVRRQPLRPPARDVDYENSLYPDTQATG
jgi:hypothetical protein